jgi:DNA-binding NtrC family response regulator
MLNECPQIIGNSHEIVKIKEMIPDLSNSIEPVFLNGESGTGRELVAKVIQYLSDRKDNPFVKVNCAALTNGMSKSKLLGKNASPFKDLNQQENGIFTVANTGTLFLYEIAQLPAVYQAELLLLVEENGSLKPATGANDSVDIRIIASTSNDVESLVDKGVFLKNLYYRLNVIDIKIPPLRHRLEDIPFLADFFADKYCAELGKSHFRLSRKIKNTFFSYHWPGNVLELENLVKGAVALGNEDSIISQLDMQNKINEYTYNFTEQTDVKKHIKDSGDLPLKDICRKINAQAEKKLMKQALERTNWNRKKAAIMLKISYKSLLNKIKAYNLT